MWMALAWRCLGIHAGHRHHLLSAEVHVRAEDHDRSQEEEDLAEGRRTSTSTVDAMHLHRSATFQPIQKRLKDRVCASEAQKKKASAAERKRRLRPSP